MIFFFFISTSFSIINFSSSVPAYFKWLSYLSWFKYGNEALLINQWSGIDDIACTRANTTCPKNGQVVLETFNFSAVSTEQFGVNSNCIPTTSFRKETFVVRCANDLEKRMWIIKYLIHIKIANVLSHHYFRNFEKKMFWVPTVYFRIAPNNQHYPSNGYEV